MAAETAEMRQQAADALKIWEQMPDTAPATLLRQHHDEAYNPFAAILLSRHNYYSLTGSGNDAEAPRKSLIHLLTALTESIVQPFIATQCREIEQVAKDLSDNIHELLGEALPAEESPALIAAITESGGRRLPLDEIIGKLSTQEHLKLVDTATLKRKIELANELKDLLWTLREGPTSMGRARYGLFFPGEEPFAEDFYPFHPFQAPTLIAPGSSLEMGLGLFEANLRHTIDNIRLFAPCRTGN